MDQKLGDLKHWRFQMPRRSEALDVGFLLATHPNLSNLLGQSLSVHSTRAHPLPSLTLHNNFHEDGFLKSRGEEGKGVKERK